MENEHLLGNPSAGAKLPQAIIAAMPFFMGASGVRYSHKPGYTNSLKPRQTGHRSEDCAHIRPIFDWNSS